MNDYSMHELVLAGCTVTPLAGYLKALGIFRLVAEQKDQDVKACWRDDRFVLVSRLGREELAEFLLQEYQPTPILSPWNGRAGYLEGEGSDDSTRRGAVLLRTFRESKALRLKPFRALIATLDGLAPLTEMNAVRTAMKSLKKEKQAKINDWTEEKQSRLAAAIKRQAFLKDHLLNLLRDALPDEQLPWLDAAVAIGSERAYAPLLGGSGGVEGSMDLGVNFMDNLLLLLAADNEVGNSTVDAPAWLEHALDGTHARLTKSNSAGSLSPGRVGGPNATSGFSQDLGINPWDFVLMIEGAVTFKPSLTRKLESSGQARLSYPFTVEPTAVGAGGVSFDDEKKTRAGSSELWMPLWCNLAYFTEVVTLLREGNIRQGGKAPRDGLDMARCIAKLGIDRGIHGFQRYLFLKRSGDNDLSIPLSRVEVSRTRTFSAPLIDDLDQGGFLDRLCCEARDKDAPASLKRAVAQLENALFALTRPGGGRQAVQHALILLGEVMRALSVSRKGQNAVFVLPRLSIAWVMQAHDESAEFRIALALASLGDLSAYLAPVARDKGHWQWAPDSRLCVWGKGDLTRNLARVVERRVIEAQREEGEPFSAYARLGARLTDIQAFLSGHTDDRFIAALLYGLIWTELPDELIAVREAAAVVPAVPVTYAILKPYFAPLVLLKKLGRVPEDACLPLPSQLSRLLGADQVQKAQHLAWHRARIAGLGWPQGDAPQATTLYGPRLLAGLCIPVEPVALVRLLPRAEDLLSEDV